MKSVARHRLPSGGAIDRSRILRFSFGGRALEGYHGDTLASALLAHGIHFVGRSFKYHRPRGILTAGPEEPNALVRAGHGARATPNLRATEIPLADGLRAAPQNAWPSLDFDLYALNRVIAPFIPAGFYYKTFMSPRAGWQRLYEPLIRRAAGLGVAPDAPDPAAYERRHAYCDLLIVGAGPAGLAAARAAVKNGARVFLVEQDFILGGSLLSRTGETIEGKPARDWLRETENILRDAPNLTLLKRTTCYAAHDHGLRGLHQHLPPADTADNSAPIQRLWWLRAKKTILACGAIERPMIFAGNDLPGVMLANAAAKYVNRFAVKPGDRSVFLTNNDSAYASALSLIESGMEVSAIIDTRQSPDSPQVAEMVRHGVAIIPGSGVASAHGWHDLHHIEVGAIDADGRLTGAGKLRLRADLLAVSGGWTPTLHLASHLGHRAHWDDDRGCMTLDETPDDITLIGGAAGTFDMPAALSEGARAVNGDNNGAGNGDNNGAGNGDNNGAGNGDNNGAAKISSQRNNGPIRIIDMRRHRRARAFVDYQNDATAKDLELAVREGYESIEHVKRYTTTGMATDQGKLANVNAIDIVSRARGVAMSEIGATTYRPPYTPVTLAAFAGRELDDFLMPERLSPLHEWSRSRGAEFEPVGDWQRAWYYPLAGEDMAAAVQRESLAVRESVGFMDASTLGKIEIRGADAAEFLNRIYTGGFKKMAVGRCRYGLMLNEEGVLFDDGVVTRTGEDTFYISTTTGGAARVMSWLELWRQTEWPDLRVAMFSVSEQWASLAVNGPKSRRVLRGLTDINLDDEAFPYLHFREGKVCGLRSRVLRISFTGELGYELHVPPSGAAAVADALMESGAGDNITIYGTETMHLLRAEKGYIIVGQDTEGTTTADDLGLSGLCSTKKDYIGRRGAERAGLRDVNLCKQLVGLLPGDGELILPEGAALTAPRDGDTLTPPFDILGHVTSSYRSPVLGRSFALGLLLNGRARAGGSVLAYVNGAGVECEVVSPVFLDSAGERLRGED
ncbi:MAG: sarcosine oxidase subunit alpha family protein, partial [Alphaproteobacteria bacterium]|nr:sarcosine oxidase subunit alpha family protein [Alphaproteobacteria bacterium]